MKKYRAKLEEKETTEIEERTFLGGFMQNTTYVCNDGEPATHAGQS